MEWEKRICGVGKDLKWRRCEENLNRGMGTGEQGIRYVDSGQREGENRNNFIYSFHFGITKLVLSLLIAKTIKRSPEVKLMYSIDH